MNPERTKPPLLRQDSFGKWLLATDYEYGEQDDDRSRIVMIEYIDITDQINEVFAPEEAMPIGTAVRASAKIIRDINEQGTAGDYTFEGVLYEMLMNIGIGKVARQA